MEICRRLALATLYLVTEQTLWDQTYERFRRRLGDKVVGRIGAGKWEPKLITIAMAQSVAPKLGAGSKEFADVKVIIVDEVHLFTGDKKRKRDEDGNEIKRPPANWQLIMQKIPAPYRFGMSGTPITETETRDMNLIGMTGPMFAEISNRELVDMGFSALPRITFVRYAGTPRKIKWADDAYREMIVECRERNQAMADLCRAHRGEQVLILCNWETHCRIVKKVLDKSGIDTVMLSGRDDVRTRKRWLAAFRGKRIQALVVTPIFDQGIDVPEIDVLIMAGGMGVSPVKPLQRLGRGLRTRPDKDEVTVYDFDDAYQKDTATHSRRRMHLFRKEKFAVEIKHVTDIKKGRS
jgi:superfamily II DNA or RNA helicase